MKRIMDNKRSGAQIIKVAIIALLMIITLPSALHAGMLKGYIRDSETNNELIGATIAVKGTTIGTVTDMNGYYELPALKEGEYNVVASYIGYEPEEITIKIGSKETREQNFYLVPSSFDMEEVVVTVQAQGQLSALNQQLKSKYITNRVSSERLQEVPDATAAESLGRLPGVTVTSDNGEGNKVQIRGMEPRLNLVTVNGVRAPSGDETESSVGLAGISPFMIEGIEVQKSLTPDKDADVIGGIVDLKLKDAAEGFHANVVLQNNINSIVNSNFNPRATLQLSNRFLNNKLGVVVVGNYENVDRSSERMSASVDIEENKNTGNVNVIMDGGNFWNSDLSRKRYGGSLFLDYQLPRGSIKASSFINGLNNNEHTRSFQNTNVVNQIRREVSSFESNRFSIVNSLKIKHKLFWNSTLEVSGAYTKAKKETPQDYGLVQTYLTPSWADPTSAPEEIRKIRRGTNVFPYDLSVYNNYVADTSFFISHLSSNNNVFTEDEVTAQADWEFPFNISDHISGNIKVGGKYRKKNREYDASDRGTSLTGGDAPDMRAAIINSNPDINFGSYTEYVGSNLSILNLRENYEETILDDQFRHHGFVGRDYMEQIIANLDKTNWQPSSVAVHARRNIPDDYKGNESVLASYAMTELNLTKYLLLVGGVRLENIKTDYRSFGVEETGINEFVIEEFNDEFAKRENTFILPMVNAKIMPTDWINLRFAYTQSIARPRYYSYMPRYRLNRLGYIENIGNPDLKPALSHNYDAYVSLNANRVGLLAGVFTAGIFYKRIEDYEYVKSFKNLADSVNVVHPYDVIADNRAYTIDVPLNNPYDAYSKGIELDWQSSFWYLPSPFNGLVINANYTQVETEQTQVIQKVDIIKGDNPWETESIARDSSFTTALFNQPKYTVNLSIGYDFKGFSARLAYRYTARTFTRFNSGSTRLSTSKIYSDEHAVWDLSLTQKIKSIDGLQLFLNVSNITSTYNHREYFNHPNGNEYPVNEEYFGRVSIIGIRYTL